MRREKSLRLPHRFEPPHSALPFSGRLMRILCPIIHAAPAADFAILIHREHRWTSSPLIFRNILSRCQLSPQRTRRRLWEPVCAAGNRQGSKRAGGVNPSLDAGDDLLDQHVRTLDVQSEPPRLALTWRARSAQPTAWHVSAQTQPAAANERLAQLLARVAPARASPCADLARSMRTSITPARVSSDKEI
jgi:hypothetical protein